MLTTSSSFFSFILKEKINRNYLIIVTIAAILQIIIFKLLYPYADFFSDSYAYIYVAATHQGTGIWPIGYSKFIWVFHKITHSDTALVAFQYLFVEATALYFFFTTKYFYNPSSQISNIIFAFLFFNPLYLYLCNYISSDGPFLALSLLWVVDMIWLIHRPRPYHILSQALVVAIAFTFRYNAMYYPIITALAFVLSRQKIQFKLIGIVLPLLLIGIFVTYTRSEALKLTGTKQFSVFSGWQLANNALYMYPHITVKEQPPVECQEFHQVVKKYFSIVPEELKYISPRQGAFYIKFSKAPLKQYVSTHFDFNKDSTDGVAAWGSVAPIYGSYGSFLIKHHPTSFARYFLLPNATNYFLPPLEKLEVYNLGDNQVQQLAQLWFHYSSTKVRAVSMTAQGRLLVLFPSFFLALNFIFIISFLWILFNRIKNIPKEFKFDLVLVGSLFIVNVAFGILASPIVFRYQVFPMILIFTFAMVVIGRDASEK